MLTQHQCGRRRTAACGAHLDVRLRCKDQDRGQRQTATYTDSRYRGVGDGGGNGRTCTCACAPYRRCAARCCSCTCRPPAPPQTTRGRRGWGKGEERSGVEWRLGSGGDGAGWEGRRQDPPSGTRHTTIHAMHTTQKGNRGATRRPTERYPGHRIRRARWTQHRARLGRSTQLFSHTESSAWARKATCGPEESFWSSYGLGPDPEISTFSPEESEREQASLPWTSHARGRRARSSAEHDSIERTRREAHGKHSP